MTGGRERGTGWRNRKVQEARVGWGAREGDGYCTWLLVQLYGASRDIRWLTIEWVRVKVIISIVF